MSLSKRFNDNWQANRFVNGEQKVLLAVSGGIDSMVLAALFLEHELSFGVAHCNYGLRGEASDLDEALVKEWCMNNGITFHNVRFDTKQISQEWKKGIQETARILRYEWFEQLRTEHKYARVATAHHADDNAETLLINLFRGTGINGLHGISPDNGTIIRPLLFATRLEIEQYVMEKNVSYRNDASNESDDYLRNTIRHKVIPVIKEWLPNVVGNLNDSISRFEDAGLLYRKAIEQEKKKLLETRGQDHYIPILKLKNRKPLSTICYELLAPFGFTPGQTEQVLHLLDSESGHFVASESHRVIRNRDFLVITTLPSASADLIVIDALPCVIDTGGCSYSFSLQDPPKTIPHDADAAYIDMAQVQLPFFIRKWKAGDYLYPLGMNMKKKKVSRLLIDEKVALHDKEHIRVIECDKRIAWVAGIRLDERFKIKAGTKKVLLVKKQK